MTVILKSPINNQQSTIQTISNLQARSGAQAQPYGRGIISIQCNPAGRLNGSEYNLQPQVDQINVGDRNRHFSNDNGPFVEDAIQSLAKGDMFGFV
jgi:hypothetical protein